MKPSGDGAEVRPQARAEGLIAERVGQELVIFDETSQMAHSLPPDAALVWDHCDGRMSQAEIASKLQLPAPVVEQAVDELRASGLLVNGGGHTRREVGKRFAAVGGAALAAPLLYSVAVPGAALAKTGTCAATVVDQNDWNEPSPVGQWIWFSSYLNINTGGDPDPTVFNITDVSVQYFDCATSKFVTLTSPYPVAGTGTPDAQITFSTGATATAVYNPPSVAHPNGQWVTTAPLGGSNNVFATGLYIDYAQATTVTNAFSCGKLIQWTFTITCTVGAALTNFNVESAGFNGKQFGQANVTDFPGYDGEATAPVAGGLNVVVAGSGGNVTKPQHPVGTIIGPGTGGSNGSGASSAGCTCKY